MEYTKTDLEVLLACGRAVEIFSFDELHAIKENWRQVGNYIEVNQEYGYPEIKARVLQGDSGMYYIYWL